MHALLADSFFFRALIGVYRFGFSAKKKYYDTLPLYEFDKKKRWKTCHWPQLSLCNRQIMQQHVYDKTCMSNDMGLVLFFLILTHIVSKMLPELSPLGR